jgi:hypothetical protein
MVHAQVSAIPAIETARATPQVRAVGRTRAIIRPRTERTGIAGIAYAIALSIPGASHAKTPLITAAPIGSAILAGITFMDGAASSAAAIRSITEKPVVTGGAIRFGLFDTAI